MSEDADTVTLPPITFTPADVPPDAPTTDAVGASGDLACETCGTPLHYKGKGRRPRFCDEHKPTRAKSTTVRGSAADVNAALAQMDVLYSLATGALMMFRPELAGPFNERAAMAQQVNRSAFESDRALAKRVAGNAAGMAPVMFVAAQAYVAGPVATAIYQASRKPKPNRNDTPTSDSIPFAAFGVNGHTSDAGS